MFRLKQHEQGKKLPAKTTTILLWGVKQEIPEIKY